MTLERAGHRAESRAAAAHASSLTGTSWGAYNLACYRALSGDGAGALADLQRALDLGFADTLIADDPDLRSLRDGAEFQRIAASVEERLTSRRQQSSSIFPWQS